MDIEKLMELKRVPVKPLSYRAKELPKIKNKQNKPSMLINSGKEFNGVPFYRFTKKRFGDMKMLWLIKKIEKNLFLCYWIFSLVWCLILIYGLNFFIKDFDNAINIIGVLIFVPIFMFCFNFIILIYLYKKWRKPLS